MDNFKDLTVTEYQIVVKEIPTPLLLEELDRRVKLLDKKLLKLADEKDEILNNDSLEKLQKWIESNR